MAGQALEIKKYPIGKFKSPKTIEPDLYQSWVRSLEAFPGALRTTLKAVDEDQLAARYRQGGWSVRQLVHHIADSHMNGYIRMKMALTEDNPIIKSYQEKGWARLADTDTVAIEVSLALLENLHERWLALIRNLNTPELSRSFYHPENKMSITVAECVGLYAWHGQHHLAHIQMALRETTD